MEDRTPRYLTMTAIGRPVTLVIDSRGIEDPIEVSGPNHAAAAERMARDLDLIDEFENETDCEFWPAEMGEPIG